MSLDPEELEKRVLNAESRCLLIRACERKGRCRVESRFGERKGLQILLQTLKLHKS
jgi:hypothetical protein